MKMKLTRARRAIDGIVKGERIQLVNTIHFFPSFFEDRFGYSTGVVSGLIVTCMHGVILSTMEKNTHYTT